jgi:hypothetical protein
MRRYLRRAEASAYLHERYGIRAAVATMAKWAVTGEGPRFHYDGRFPIYSMEDLDIWAAERLSKPVKSTSERREAAA